MKIKKRLHRGLMAGGRDFQTRPVKRYYLCYEEANNWFDLRGVDIIELKLSDTPNKHAYKCEFQGCNIRVYDPQGKSWSQYYSYSELRDWAAIHGIGDGDEVYLSIDVVK